MDSKDNLNEQAVVVMLDALGLQAMVFKGPVRFYNMGGGGARQDFEAVDEPRFGYTWEMAKRRDGAAQRKFYTVDGREVADLEEAAKLLALPEPEDSPRAVYRRRIAEYFEEPKTTNFMRAGNEAEGNWRAGPFAMMKAFTTRASSAWHCGINKYAEALRLDGQHLPHPHWLYKVKDAAYEASRLMALFAMDRKKDEDLRCALGKRCRDCPILQTIEAHMVADKNTRLSRGVEEWDIDAAKTWTCIGHILHERIDIFDGGFISTGEHRKDGF